MKNQLWFYSCLSQTLFILLCGYEFSVLPNLYKTLHPLILPLLTPLVPLINSSAQASERIVSDSSSQFILVVLIYSTALFLTPMLFRFSSRIRKIVWKPIALGMSQYILALFLMIYGVNKLFQWQFPFPTPNMLYTPVGQMSCDLLYWTTIGSSPTYNVITGLLEVICSALLLLRTTWLFGGIMACGIFCQIVAINFSFNISVKLFSTFLFAHSLILLVSHPRVSLLFGAYGTIPVYQEPRHKARQAMHVFFTLLILAEAFVPVLRLASAGASLSGNAQAHIPLFGAYYVHAQATEESPAMVFVHDQGYLITMDQTGLTSREELWIKENGDFILSPRDSSATFIGKYNWQGDTLYLPYRSGELTLTRAKYDQLPLTQDRFRLFCDSP